MSTRLQQQMKILRDHRDTISFIEGMYEVATWRHAHGIPTADLAQAVQALLEQYEQRFGPLLDPEPPTARQPHGDL
jgi:hypothetical protein